MKHPKFVIAENPMTDGDEHPLYVIHLRDPLIVAQVFTFSPDEEDKRLELLRNPDIIAYSTTDIDSLESAVLLANYIAPMKGEAQASADKLAKIMRRMADWYRAYCLWEDNNIVNEE